MAHFTPSLFDFLEDLAANNRRDWFQANKQRYRTDVQDPLLRFVDDFEDRLASISPHMVADSRRSGGSVFRIYRDVRFSKDKTPYKTNAGVQFRHEAGRDVHGPGLYLHLEPGMVFAGAGLWRPNATTAGKIREAIVENPDRWRQIVDEPDFASTYPGRGVAETRPEGSRPPPPPDPLPEVEVVRGHHQLLGRGNLHPGLHRPLHRHLPGGCALHRIPHRRGRPRLVEGGSGPLTEAFWIPRD